MGSNVAYCASKARARFDDQIAGTCAGARDQGRFRFPGLVDTDFVKGLDQYGATRQAARTPLKRLATADEIGGPRHWPSSPTSATLPAAYFR